ncbi:MAG: adenosine deaminase [Bacteroidia bacterium]|nr:adenosine deaminase [Bacteroidia bacterium]
MEVSVTQFIKGLPKAELHLHIEGSFEPKLMFEIAKRNGIKLPYTSVEELQAAYQFNNLQEFLDIYYQGAQVLLHEQDFYDLTWAYLLKIHEQQVHHTEVFFDPQTHTDRGVAFDTVLDGIYRALSDGEEKLGISFRLIMCFLRHLPESAAFKTLESALPHKDRIDGVGLDSSEVGHPPSKFERVFEQAGLHGFRLVAHAGEEGPSDYIWEAINRLHVIRIDHGNRCLDDDLLVKRLASRKIPLTLCPLSNKALQVIKNLNTYPLLAMMDHGLLVTLNSDDPAYFGGYLNENYEAVAQALSLTKPQLVTLAKNSFSASWLSNPEKEQALKRIDAYYDAHKH